MLDQLPPILGEEPVFLDAVEKCSRLALIDRPCLVVGERGTGKELFASRLHYLSPRWNGPLVKVNCAALSETLLESELFGHEMGSFTGAQKRRAGRFELADQGTLILDEIANASAAVQEKVLRVIEYGTFERVGGTETLNVDVRVIGSANVDLPEMAERGEFRADLLDRLAFDVITIPPLRARPRDILPMADSFGLDIARELGLETFLGFSEIAREAMMSHAWPGNVRELENTMHRAVLLSNGSEITTDSILLSEAGQAAASQGQGDASQGGAAMVGRTVAEVERDLIIDTLEHCLGNRTHAANILGISIRTLRNKLKLYNEQGFQVPTPGETDRHPG